MSNLDRLLEEAKLLSATERARLIKLLLSNSLLEEDEETAVAQRGLAAWTESARHEDWSAFYPPLLHTSSQDKT